MVPTLSAFELCIFGRASLRAFGQEVLGPCKPTLLLAYLACQPRRRAGRSNVIDLLWRDVPSTRGRQTLRQTIMQLHHKLDAHLIHSKEDDLILAADVKVDRDQFLSAFELEQWVDAARLAAAPVLHDAVVAGGTAFASWAEIERRHCRDLQETAVASAVAAAIRAGDRSRALLTAMHWRDADPTHEPAWRRLIATALDVGEGVRARLEAHGCIAALAQQGTAPSPVTQEILARADAALIPTGSTTIDPVRHPELTRRMPLFAALMSAQRDAVCGTAHRVLLTGDADAGKTRLLRELGAHLAASGLDVTIIAAASAMHGVEGGVLTDLVLALGSRRGATGVSAASARVLVAIAPALEKHFAGSMPVTDWHPDSGAVIRALEELLSVLADDRPQALLLDDLQWWDGPSEAAVVAALARCGHARLLVVATSRQPEPAFPCDESHVLLPPSHRM